MLDIYKAQTDTRGQYWRKEFSGLTEDEAKSKVEGLIRAGTATRDIMVVQEKRFLVDYNVKFN